MLAPTKPMFVEEFVIVCKAVGANPGEVIREAERRAAPSATRSPVLRSAIDRVNPVSDVDFTIAEPDAAEQQPHSTTVSEQDIAAGASLPLQGGDPPRSRRTRGTSRTRHTR
jgi:hypothetical protein